MVPEADGTVSLGAWLRGPRAQFATRPGRVLDVVCKAPLSSPDPYRDDRESLLAENRRLRRRLVLRRRRRLWPALVALVAYGALLIGVGDWLHGQSEVKYWIAIALLLGALGASVLFAVNMMRGFTDQGD